MAAASQPEEKHSEYAQKHLCDAVSKALIGVSEYGTDADAIANVVGLNQEQIKSGRVYICPNWKLQQLHKAGHLKDADTTNYMSKGKEGYAAFVWTAKDELIVFDHYNLGHGSRIAHSSATGSQPVKAAGEIMIEKGEVIAITNSSGHYPTSSERLKWVLEQLPKQALHKDCKVHLLYGLPGTYQSKAKIDFSHGIDVKQFLNMPEVRHTYRVKEQEIQNRNVIENWAPLVFEAIKTKMRNTLEEMRRSTSGYGMEKREVGGEISSTHSSNQGHVKSVSSDGRAGLQSLGGSADTLPLSVTLTDGILLIKDSAGAAGAVNIAPYVHPNDESQLGW